MLDVTPVGLRPPCVTSSMRHPATEKPGRTSTYHSRESVQTSGASSEGFEAALTRKHRATSARARIFDGEKEAKLIALACSAPPRGRAKWTLRLLEDKVVELNIVERASDNTIGRTLKKTFSSLISKSNG